MDCVRLRIAALPGIHEWGTDNYCEFIHGDLDSNIIICVPHGGHLQPVSMPDRQSSYKDIQSAGLESSTPINAPIATPVFRSDVYTRSIAITLTEELGKLTGKRPHLILNHLDRTKFDGNRGPFEATYGSTSALQAFEEFHSFIASARDMINGRGLFFDIHGQSHPEEWIEFGYCIKTVELNADNLNADASSIRSLWSYAAARYPGMTFDELLRGLHSLGHLLFEMGYKTIPCPVYQKPGDMHYYRGGFNTSLYGSKDGGDIDGIQVEIPSIYRSPETCDRFALGLANAISQFAKKYDYVGQEADVCA